VHSSYLAAWFIDPYTPHVPNKRNINMETFSESRHSPCLIVPLLTHPSLPYAVLRMLAIENLASDRFRMERQSPCLARWPPLWNKNVRRRQYEGHRLTIGDVVPPLHRRPDFGNYYVHTSLVLRSRRCNTIRQRTNRSQLLYDLRVSPGEGT
jgi:hypothetical protein